MKISKKIPKHPFLTFKIKYSQIKHLTETMDRKFTVRTNGLYKKANTLFNILGTKVAIIVQNDYGTAQGYVSHETSDWPDLYEALGLLGVDSQDILRPDNFDTVADRNTRRLLSFSSSGLSTAPSNGGSATDHDETDRRQMVEMLTAVMEEPAPCLGSETNIDPLQPTALIEPFPSPPSSSGTHSPHQTQEPNTVFLTGSESQAERPLRPLPRLTPETKCTNNSGTEWAYNEVNFMPRGIGPSTEASCPKRKRRSGLGHGEKRRRVVTRSQGGGDPLGRRR